MGLVPILVDPRRLSYIPGASHSCWLLYDDVYWSFFRVIDGESPSDQDSLVFTLKAIGKQQRVSAVDSAGAREPVVLIHV